MNKPLSTEWWFLMFAKINYLMIDADEQRVSELDNVQNFIANRIFKKAYDKGFDQGSAYGYETGFQHGRDDMVLMFNETYKDLEKHLKDKNKDQIDEIMKAVLTISKN